MKKIRYYSNFVMVAVYAGVGVFLIFTNAAEQLIPDNRQGFGTILIIYAAYRLYSAYTAYKTE